VRVAFIIPTKAKTFRGQIATGKSRISSAVKAQVNRDAPQTLPEPRQPTKLYSKMIGGNNIHRDILSYKLAMSKMYN